MMPVLYPSSVQEIIDLGLHGWAMSRYSGCWVGFKCVTDMVESSASVLIDPDRVQIVMPDDFPLSPDGVHIRWPDPFLATEARMHDYKIYAALHYCRVNKLNRIVIDSPKPRFGIITSGKSYLDVRQALDDLGITEADAAEIGIRVYKVAMPWPLEPEGVRQFAEGLTEILVVEEKRQIVEYQIKEQLYNWRDDVRPACRRQVRRKGRMGAAARRLAAARHRGADAGDDRARHCAAHRAPRTASAHHREDQEPRRLHQREGAGARQAAHPLQRVPYFCSGCPHNTSTKVPEGSRATAGIGCHVMAIWMDRSTSAFTHMGGEGVPWIGLSPFTEEKHMFANLGDGTYYHSGILAIRAAVAANVNITYKILYNDAVAMTGGQPVDGPLTSRRHRAPGRRRRREDRRRRHPTSPRSIPSGYFAPDIEVHHRDDLDEVQRDAARDAGRHGAALRPDLRGGKAPPPQARQVPRSGQARRHQRTRLRRLRRLRRQIQLRVGRTGRNRIRTQAHDRPVVLQQGLLLRQRLLPELRHRRRRQAAQAEEGGGGRFPIARPTRRRSARSNPTAS